MELNCTLTVSNFIVLQRVSSNRLIDFDVNSSCVELRYPDILKRKEFDVK
jgi:hypothetical protein